MLLAITIFVLVLYIFLGVKTPRFAVITLPVITTVFVILSASEELVAPAIISICILPVTLTAVLFMRHEQDVVPWPKRAAGAALATLLAISLLVVFSMITSTLGAAYLGLLGLLFGYALGVAYTQKHFTTAFVISTIGASIRQNLPLPMALQSASEDIKYQHSQILRRISNWLVQGYSLSESIKRGFKKCPARITAQIAAGEKMGQVPQVMQSIEADLLEKSADSKRVKPIYPASYFITVFIAMTLITLGLMIGVIPKFSAVMKEMLGNELPKATIMLITIADYICFRYGWAIIVGIIFVMAIFHIKGRFQSRRPERPRLLSRFSDFIKWHLPILHWFENNYSMLQVVEILRISLKAGNTINEAIRNTIDLDVNGCFRKRLQKWLRKVEAGDDAGRAVRECGLASSLSLAFEQQSNPENTLSVLEMLESVYRSNYSYRVNLARFILLPCTTLCLGAMVGFVTYSILSAIVAIIYQCASLV